MRPSQFSLKISWFLHLPVNSYVREEFLDFSSWQWLSQVTPESEGRDFTQIFFINCTPADGILFNLDAFIKIQKNKMFAWKPKQDEFRY